VDLILCRCPHTSGLRTGHSWYYTGWYIHFDYLQSITISWVIHTNPCNAIYPWLLHTSCSSDQLQSLSSLSWWYHNDPPRSAKTRWMTDPPTNLNSSIFLSSPLFVSHVLCNRNPPSSPFRSVIKRMENWENVDISGFVEWEGDRDLHGFTRENKTLLNRWNTSLLLNLLFHFRDLPISSTRSTSSSRCKDHSGVWGDISRFIWWWLNGDLQSILAWRQSRPTCQLRIGSKDQLAYFLPGQRLSSSAMTKVESGGTYSDFDDHFASCSFSLGLSYYIYSSIIPSIVYGSEIALMSDDWCLQKECKWSSMVSSLTSTTGIWFRQEWRLSTSFWL
jgi:hypothetical protein